MINLHIIEYIPVCDDEHTPQLWQYFAFSNSLVAQLWQNILNYSIKQIGLLESKETCWNKPRNYISRSVAQSRWGDWGRQHNHMRAH
jgi:hypothetical protein